MRELWVSGMQRQTRDDHGRISADCRSIVRLSHNKVETTMIRRVINRLFPRAILATLRNIKILSIEFGQYRTMRLWDCIDLDGNPIPWYSYPAIEYIKQLDLSDKSIFDYGSGNSTRFWADRCEKLVSVEDNREWYDNLKAKVPATVEYHCFEHKTAYIESIRQFHNEFDIIIIDGSHRYDCAVEALTRLRYDGFIILDNSDWKETTSKLLRDSDLIEVDMSGFGPINGYTWTTSFYFRRNVKLSPAQERQPIHGIGSLKQT